MIRLRAMVITLRRIPTVFTDSEFGVRGYCWKGLIVGDLAFWIRIGVPEQVIHLAYLVAPVLGRSRKAI